MNGRGMSLLARWGLLCVLVLAVATMHHVDAAPAQHAEARPGTSMSMSAPAGHQLEGHPAAPQDDSHSSLLHLCLAVLAAVGGLLLVVFFAGRITEHLSRPRHARPWRGTNRGPPPPAGRELLTLACVIRV